MRKYGTLWGLMAAISAISIVVISCGGTGGGGGHSGNPQQQFILNSNNTGRLILNVNPNEVDANKSDRIGLVATLTDGLGQPIIGVTILFTSDIPDIRFIPDTIVSERHVGQAVTDAHGNADIIAVAGVSPTGTGAIVGTGAIFAQPPAAFGLRAQSSVTLLDIGFIDADALGVIPPSMTVTEPAPGSVIFFNVVGGTPPYFISDENSALGTATLGQRCLPGCTESSSCIGSPCQSDTDCGVGSPDGTCVGPIKRCLASCAGSNCAGARCDTDNDCNNGSAAPANVCKDSGQSIAFTLSGGGDCPDGCLAFSLQDAAGASVDVTLTVLFVCGNGVASGTEQCDLASVNDSVCDSFGLPPGCTLGQVGGAFCIAHDIDPTGATVTTNCTECKLDLACVGGATPVPTATP